MNNTTNPTTATDAMPDTRPALLEALDVALDLVSTTSPQDLGNQTPCSDYTVKDLNDHFVLVVRRLVVMGRGESWEAVQPEPIAIDQQLIELEKAAVEMRQVWADPARLGQVMEAPFATLPGIVVGAMYTSELLTHSWDLAAATGRTVVASDAALSVAHHAIQSLPADDRDADDIPFGHVVQVAADTPMIEQIVAWTGRNPADWN